MNIRNKKIWMLSFLIVTLFVNTANANTALSKLRTFFSNAYIKHKKHLPVSLPAARNYIGKSISFLNNNKALAVTGVSLTILVPIALYGVATFISKKRKADGIENRTVQGGDNGEKPGKKFFLKKWFSSLFKRKPVECLEGKHSYKQKVSVQSNPVSEPVNADKFGFIIKPKVYSMEDGSCEEDVFAKLLAEKKRNKERKSKEYKWQDNFLEDELQKYETDENHNKQLFSRVELDIS